MVTTGCKPLNKLPNRLAIWRDARPRSRTEDQDCKPTMSKTLLEANLLVRCNEYLEASFFRRTE